MTETEVNVRARPDGLGVGRYSSDGAYRYWFSTETEPSRRPGAAQKLHDKGLPLVDANTLVWVGLNPSRSDEGIKPRPTLQTVLHWASRAGHSRVLGINLYAYRLTDSAELKRGLRDGSLGDVVSPENDAVLRHISAQSDHTHFWLGARLVRGVPRWPGCSQMGCASGCAPTASLCIQDASPGS